MCGTSLGTESISHSSVMTAQQLSHSRLQFSLTVISFDLLDR